MQVTNCVLVTLTIKNWDANTQDRRVSADVASANHVTEQRMCRLRKSLLPKSAALDSLNATARAARTFHYENTHAWMHEGPRMLPTKNLEHYMAKMREFKNAFQAATLEFIEAYPQIQEQARTVLGKLYDESDYPAASALRHRYALDASVQPMPASDNLLDLGLVPQEAAEFKRKLEADMAETFRKANRRLWEDLFARLEKLYSKLSDEKGRVRQDTLDAVRELAEMLPRMNITNDVQLENLANRLKESLAGLSSETIKNDPGARERAAATTQGIFTMMQSMMRPQSAAQGEKRAA